MKMKNNDLKKYAQQHYILFSIFAAMLMVVPISLFLKLSSADLKQGLVGIDIMLIRIGIAIGVMTSIRFFLPNGKIMFGKNTHISKGIIYGLPYLALSVVVTIISNFGADFSTVKIPSLNVLLPFTLNMFLIGFNEEFLFRGLILNNLFISFGKTKHALYKAIWISSACFGLMHIANIFVPSTETTLIQMFSAVFGGVLFCGIYLKSKSIWVAVTIHALLDFIAFILSVFNIGSVLSVKYQWYEGLIVMVIGSLIQLGYGLVLLRKIEINNLQM